MPLDYICLKSGVLCPRCRKLVDEGKVQQFEVDLMKALIELEEKSQDFKFLREATYVKGYLVDNFCVLILELPEDVTQHSLIRLSRVLSDKVGLKVRVVKKVNDMKMLIAQIVAPARIQGVNALWLPDGSVQHIVRIPRYDAKSLPTSVENLEKLFNEIFGTSIRIKLS